jgi:hypothetical protein
MSCTGFEDQNGSDEHFQINVAGGCKELEYVKSCTAMLLNMI